MNWEIKIDTYTLLIQNIANKNLIYSTGNSIQCFVVT